MDILQFLRNKLVPERTPVAPAEVKKVATSKDDSEMWRCYGITNESLRQIISDQNLIIYERSSIYQVVDRSLNHALMSAACVAFADSACQRSPLHGSTVWVTSDNREYRYQIEKMLDIINIEECIYDWAWTTAAFGDLFVEVFGEPGVGIVCVNDDNHPINVSRVDHNGRLVGFFQTPLGYATTDTRKLLAPWDHVHFRLLGAKKRRPLYQDQQYSEFRTISIMTPDARRLTSKYGTSILADALPIWKRLRLAEDSIMMARIMKSPQRFLFKVVIPEDNANAEAVAHLVDQYQSEIKRARSLNTDPNNPSYLDRFNAMAGAEDLIFPVWGSSDNLTVETLGGETDIRWIADIDKLENQLITALKVPKQLLAGFSGEGGGGFEGGTALERMDIRFARQARRVQRSLIVGLTRMAQIHLAYQGLDPDLDLFQIHMSETSSAEEVELQDSLGKSVDATRALYDMLVDMVGVDLDKKKLLEYFNEKFFKLSDLNLDELYMDGDASKIIGDHRDLPVPGVEPTPGGGGGEEFPGGIQEPIEPAPGTEEIPAPGAEEEAGGGPNAFKESYLRISDLFSPLPNTKSGELWEATWKEKPVNVLSVPIHEGLKLY